MRFVILLSILMLAGCGGYTPGPQQASLPVAGGPNIRDGFYDGGIFDRDLVPDPGDPTRDPL